MPYAKRKQKTKRKKSDDAIPPVEPFHPSPETVGHIKQLLDCVPPARLRKNLLYIFLIFLEREHEMLPFNFRQMVSDYYMLFHFLDKIEDEMK